MNPNAPLDQQTLILRTARRASTSGRMDVLDELLDAFTDLGLDGGPIPEALRRREYARTLGQARLTARATESEKGHLTADLAEGVITVEDAIAKAVIIEQRAKTDGLAAKVISDARGVVRRSIWDVLGKAGDAIVTEQLLHAVREVVDEATALTSDLGDISDDTAAINGTPTQTAAWVRLRALTARWHALHTLADELRAVQVLPVTDTTFFPVAYRYANPDKAPKAPAYPPLVLADAIRNGAGPTIRTDTEVQEAGHGAVRIEHPVNPPGSERAAPYMPLPPVVTDPTHDYDRAAVAATLGS